MLIVASGMHSARNTRLEWIGLRRLQRHRTVVSSISIKLKQVLGQGLKWRQVKANNRMALQAQGKAVRIYKGEDSERAVFRMIVYAGRCVRTQKSTMRDGHSILTGGVNV